MNTPERKFRFSLEAPRRRLPRHPYDKTSFNSCVISVYLRRSSLDATSPFYGTEFKMLVRKRNRTSRAGKRRRRRLQKPCRSRIALLTTVRYADGHYYGAATSFNMPEKSSSSGDNSQQWPHGTKRFPSASEASVRAWEFTPSIKSRPAKLRRRNRWPPPASPGVTGPEKHLANLGRWQRSRVRRKCGFISGLVIVAEKRIENGLTDAARRASKKAFESRAHVSRHPGDRRYDEIFVYGGPIPEQCQSTRWAEPGYIARPCRAESLNSRGVPPDTSPLRQPVNFGRPIPKVTVSTNF